MNIWGKIGLTALAIMGGSRLFAATKAMRVSDHLNINLINPRIHKLDPNPFGGGIEVRTEIKLQNPTNGKMQITQPYIQILSHEAVISSTKVSNKQFTINPLSELTLDTVSFKIDWLTIISRLSVLNYEMPKDLSILKKAGWIISNYKQIVSKLNLSVKYSTHANGLLYSDTEKIEL